MSADLTVGMAAAGMPEAAANAPGANASANTLAAYVPALREADEEFRLRLLLHDFGLVWLEAPERLRTQLIVEAPARVDDLWDAFLAAYAEHLAVGSGLAPPPWTRAPGRHLRRFWYPGGCFAWDRSRTVVTTPAAFEAHGIWFPRSELTVV